MNLEELQNPSKARDFRWTSPQDLKCPMFFQFGPMKQVVSRCQVKKSWMNCSLILDSRSFSTGNAIWDLLKLWPEILRAHKKQRFCGCSWC